MRKKHTSLSRTIPKTISSFEKVNNQTPPPSNITKIFLSSSPCPLSSGICRFWYSATAMKRTPVMDKTPA